ncbi:putative defense protein Hdd11 [Neoarius graeffei]|uniref:putative defense protein Hdd11 n=1 Tax=Neoarius graeffei TaxID=443677 RepID=UPI00298C461D|nr:putative defense protein Hdd11 [Neoarius graeffei]
MWAVLFVALLLQVWTAVTGYPSGAPVGRCEDMTPQHNVQPQSIPSPYTIVISNMTFSTNQIINVTIQGPQYIGLLLQARSGSDTNAVGTWKTPPANTKYLACSGNNFSAITHSDRTPKDNKTTFSWIPPASLKTAFITATVVSNRTTFWVKLKSSTLTGVSGGVADPKMAVTSVLFLTLLMLTVF